MTIRHCCSLKTLKVPGTLAGRQKACGMFVLLEPSPRLAAVNCAGLVPD